MAPSSPVDRNESIEQAREELASLGRVFHRIAMVDSVGRLNSVLDKLLPRLLRKITENEKGRQKTNAAVKKVNEAIRTKLIEMLTHIMKRVKNEKQAVLPCIALTDILAESEKHATLCVNLTLAFLIIGVPRSVSSNLELVHRLRSLQQLRLGSPALKMQSVQLAQLFLHCITSTTTNSTDATDSTQQQEESALWDLCLDVLLYLPTTSTVPPAGMSQFGHERLQSHSTRVAALSLLEWIHRCSIFDEGRRLVLWAVAAGPRSNDKQTQDRARYFIQIFMERRSTDIRTDDDEHDVERILSTLLTLCLGQKEADQHLLRTFFAIPEDAATLPSQTRLSIQRRAVSETTRGSIVEFLCKYLEPRFWQRHPILLEKVAPLILLLAEQTLVAVPVTGLTTTRAMPMKTVAELLNTVVAQWTALEDSWSSKTNDLLRRAVVVAGVVLEPLMSHAAETHRVSNDGNVEIRHECYGLLCSLCRSSFADSPDLFRRGRSGNNQTLSVSLATLLFGCVAREDDRLRPRAIAALDALLKSYRMICAASDEGGQDSTAPSRATNPWADTTIAEPPLGDHFDLPRFLSSLLSLVWTAAQGQQSKSSRVAAARWASELMYCIEPGAGCHLLCYLSGDYDVTVASIARDGLGGVQQEDGSNRVLPDFGVLTSMIFAKASESNASFRSQTYWEFSAKGKATTLRFAIKCLLDDLYEGHRAHVDTYRHALVQTLASLERDLNRNALDHDAGFRELLEASADCLVDLIKTFAEARRDIALSTEFNFEHARRLSIQAGSSVARRNFAVVCGEFLKDSLCWPSLEARNKLLSETICECATNIQRLRNGDSGAHHRLHGSIFLSATAMRACAEYIEPGNSSNTTSISKPQLTEEAISARYSLVESLGKGLNEVDETIGSACSDGIAIAFGGNVQRRGESDQGASVRLLDSLSDALKTFSGMDSVDAQRTMKCAHASGFVLLATGFANEGVEDGLAASQDKCFQRLLETLGSAAFRKDEEVSIIVGEALARCCRGTGKRKSQAWPTGGFEESVAVTLGKPDRILYALVREILKESSPHRRTSVAPALLALVAKALDGKLKGEVRDGSLCQAVLEHIEEVQDVFLCLLGDPKSKHLSRECCCMGLVACRGLVDRSAVSSQGINLRLLRAFGQTTVFAESALIETATQARQRRAEEGRMQGESVVTEEQETVGEEGGTASTSEAALGAYREMATVCVSLGKHDVLYLLLTLSLSHPFWSSQSGKVTYCATSLLGSSGDELFGSTGLGALKPHMGSILPKILRAKHSPNVQTRDQMTALWAGLTGGGASGRATISLHFKTTLDVLIEDTSNRYWRARVGACGALAEIVAGRSWAELGGGDAVLSDDYLYESKTTQCGGSRLLRLWRASMRALDDTRPAVRDRGGALARAVRALSISLCDPSIQRDALAASKLRCTGEKRQKANDTSAAAATALRWLIHHGLNQPGEGNGICISTLLEIVGLVTPRILEPALPELLQSLLLAVSGLEPAALNYLQLRTSDQASLERARLQLAQTGPIASAINKCLDLTSGTKQETQREVLSKLDTTLHLSSGFATRAATADAVVSLCNSCPGAFDGISNGSNNPAVRLLRAFYTAIERERTPSSRDRMIHAFGHLASVCPGQSVRSLCVKSIVKYTQSTGSNFDREKRFIASATVRAVARRASKQMLEGGNNNVWCTKVYPVAFLAKRDSDSKIAANWNDIWEDADQAIASGMSGKVVGTSKEEKLLRYIVAEAVKGLEDASWSRRADACEALCEMSSVLRPLPTGTQDSFRTKRRAEASLLCLEKLVVLSRKPRFWTGKEKCLRALSCLVKIWSKAHIESPSDASCHVVSLSAGERHIDLFEGDGWFDGAHEPLEETAETEKHNRDDEELESQTQQMAEEISGNVDNDSAGSSATCDRQITLPTVVGICKLLLAHGIAENVSEHVLDQRLQYRKDSFDCLRGIVDVTGGTESHLSQILCTTMSHELLNFVNKACHPPVLIAAAVKCLGSSISMGYGNVITLRDAGVMELADVFALLGGTKQPAWTIREACALSHSQLVSRCFGVFFRKNEFISRAVDCAACCLTDRKFWKVRCAGLNILNSLVQRAGKDRSAKNDQEKLQVLEALLPHKEKVQQLLHRCLGDSESNVSLMAVKIKNTIEWWP